MASSRATCPPELPSWPPPELPASPSSLFGSLSSHPHGYIPTRLLTCLSRGFPSCSPNHNPNHPFGYLLNCSPNCPLSCPLSGYLLSCLPNCASHCLYGYLPTCLSNCYPKHSPTYPPNHPWSHPPTRPPNRLLSRHCAPSRHHNFLLTDLQCPQSCLLTYLHNCLSTCPTLPCNTALVNDAIMAQPHSGIPPLT